MGSSYGGKRWSYRTANLHKWREVRCDSTVEKAFAARLREVMTYATTQKGLPDSTRACLITDPKTGYMYSCWQVSAVAAEAAESRIRPEAGIRRDPVDFEYACTLETLLARREAHKRAGDREKLFKQDIDYLLKAHEVYTKKQRAETMATSLDQVLSGLMGAGMAAKSTKYSQWGGAWTIELRYPKLHVTITNEDEED